MNVERVASRTSASALTVLAGLHVAWGLGSTWPLPDRETFSDLVVGGAGFPPPAACFAVAGALGTAAALVAGRPRTHPALSRLGTAGTAAVLGARAAAGLAGRTDLLSPGSSSPRFRRLDRIAYAPLCLALAASTALAAAARRR
ncbi:DUF3995 domain-containing protein [Streptomyces sp. NPDC005955]|jgi:hypothetical protein|uniref:DUF3995 domain-containing protein n=1 Tax=Streptomyces sp. NPDC005955 TaxID=3364738 RepID=UPI0036819FBD